MKRLVIPVAFGLAFLRAQAARADVVVIFDEYGHGSYFDLNRNKSGPIPVSSSPNGPVAGPLTYDLSGIGLPALPANGVIALFDGGNQTNIQDYVQFKDGFIIVYSKLDEADNPPTLADQFAFPTNLTPDKTLAETVRFPEAIDGFFDYAPNTAADPGFLPGLGGPGDYTFYSDGLFTVPEPRSVVLVGLIALVVLIRVRRMAGATSSCPG
jgi:hypothetical protein